MKIFAIRDATDNAQKDLAYLLYYEVDKRFYIELPENADPWETPLLLASFAQKGEHTINSYWSRIWVQQRIVPSDRQNIAQILRDNGLKTYDEYELLMLSSGRCEQDDYYLSPEATAIAQEISGNRDLRVFFSSVRKTTPEQFKVLQDLVSTWVEAEKHDGEDPA